MQNKELIKSVKDIVSQYGEEILSSPRFWYILTDTYSFKNDYSLKTTFKKTIEKGYLEKILSVKSDPDAVKTKIRVIISSNGRSANPLNKEELKSCLLSIAVAVKACPIEEIDSFLKSKNPATKSPNQEPSSSKTKRNHNSRPKASNTTTHNPSQKPPLKSRLTLGAVILIAIGYILLAINIALYPACIKPYGAGFDAIGWFALFAQIFYVFIVKGFVSPSDPFWPKDECRATFWYIIPTLLTFILSDILSLLFFIQPIKRFFSIAIWGEPYVIITAPLSSSIQNPYFELGQIYLALLIPVVGWYTLDLYSETKKLNAPRYPYNWKAFKISLSLILLISIFSITLSLP